LHGALPEQSIAQGFTLTLALSRQGRGDGFFDKLRMSGGKLRMTGGERVDSSTSSE